MNRGTRVAQAYIALTADGSTIDDDIAKSMDDVDWEKTAKRNSEKYNKALEKHLGTDKGGKGGLSRILRRSLKDFENAFAQEDALRAGVDRMIANLDAQNLLNHTYRRVAKEAGVEFGGHFGDGIRATVHRRLRKILMEEARRGGGADEEVLGALLDTMRTSDGSGFNLPGRFFEQSIADTKKLIKIHEDQTTRLIDQALKEQERWLREHDKAVAKEVRLQEEAEADKTRFLRRFHESRQKMLKIASHDDEIYQAKQRKRLEAEREFRLAALRSARAAESVFAGFRFDPRINRQALEKARQDLERLFMDREALQIRLGKVEPADRLRIERQIQSIDGKIEVYLDRDRLQRSILQAEGLIDRSGRRIVQRSARYYQDRDMADRMGRLTGMGARNNFLNIIGRTVRQVSNLTFAASRGVSTLGKTFTSFAQTFAQGASQVGEGASLMQKALGGTAAVGKRMGSSLAMLARTGPVAIAVLGAALVALTAVASAAVSAVSALLGVVFALAGTIVSGLTAALLVGAAAFVPLIAAGGLLAATFTSLTDKQKEYLASAFTPLRDGFIGLGQIMLEKVLPAMEVWSENLQRVGALLIPLAESMGDAFAQAGTMITQALSGPGFQRLISTLGVYLPQIVMSMTAALGHLFNGLAGFFSAMLPYVARFASYLERLTLRFSEWVNSAEGQNSIVDFVDRAWASLLSLWNFTREFFGWLRDILFNPTVQEFGNTMFDGLADSFRRLRDNIADGSLERWMEDAERFGRALWETIQSLWGVFESLNNSGAITVLVGFLEGLGWAFDRVKDLLDGFISLVNGELPGTMTGMILLFNAPLLAIGLLRDAIDGLTNSFRRFLELRGIDPGFFGMDDSATVAANEALARTQANAPKPGPGVAAILSEHLKKYKDLAERREQQKRIEDLMREWGKITNIGTTARGETNIPDPSSSSGSSLETPKWVNPYVAWAESLIKDGPSMTKQISTAFKKLGKQANKTIKAALNADSGKEARQALNELRKNLRQQGKQFVDSARSTLNSAASALANASSPEAAYKALADVRRAQADLAKAQAAQKRMNAAAKILQKQQQVNGRRVNRLLAGKNAPNATLADYARAQERLANRLEKARAKLTEALTLRDDYAKAVRDSINSFGSLMTAQGKMLDGVEQDLTHSDITGNLQDRLQQIKQFQNNLRALQAMGVSDAVYKQIVDAGVEEGGRFAEALLEGGASAIYTANNLTSQIEGVAESIGIETSRSLYQAGVDAAQGLVDGLVSLQKELDQAAARLGEAIARAIRRQLGIKSPSQVLMDDMNHVGDGAVTGLRKQESKVESAAARLATFIRPNLTTAATTAGGSAGTVSGNSATHHWHITTPTENPKAVAMEMLNEVTGRLI